MKLISQVEETEDEESVRFEYTHEMKVGVTRDVALRSRRPGRNPAVGLAGADFSARRLLVEKLRWIFRARSVRPATNPPAFRLILISRFYNHTPPRQLIQQ